MAEARSAVVVRMPAKLLHAVDARHKRKQGELARLGLRPEAWSRNDQICELLGQGLREAGK